MQVSKQCKDVRSAYLGLCWFGKGPIVMNLETWEGVRKIMQPMLCWQPMAGSLIVYAMRRQRLTATASSRIAPKDAAGRHASGDTRVSLIVQTFRGPSGSPKWYFARHCKRGFCAAAGNTVPTPYRWSKCFQDSQLAQSGRRAQKFV